MALNNVGGVLEYANITGSGDYTLLGRIAGHRSFAPVGNTNTCHYVAYEVDASGNPNGAREWGIGTYSTTGPSLVRTTVIDSINDDGTTNGSAIFWSGLNTVRLTIAPFPPKSPTIDDNNIFSVAQSAPGAGSNSERWGASSLAAGAESVALGKSATATGQGSIAIGREASAQNNSSVGSVVIGNQSANINDVGGSGTVIVGSHSTADGSNNVVIATNSSLSGTAGTLIGNSSGLTNGLISIGYNVFASNFGCVAIGGFSTASHVGSFAIGNLVVSTRAREFVTGAGPISGMGSSTAGFRHRIMAETSTGDMRDAGIIDFTWSTATDASRKSVVTIYTFSTSTAISNIAFSNDGTDPTTTIYNKLIVQQNGGTPGTDEGQIYHDGTNLQIHEKGNAGAVIVYGKNDNTFRVVDENSGGTYFRVQYNAVVSGSGVFQLGETSGSNASFILNVDGVIELNNYPASEAWIQNTAGEARLGSNATNNTTTMANITDLTRRVKAGRKYKFELVIPFVNSTAAEGAKFDFDGGAATMTSFRGHALVFDSALLLSTQVSAIATDITVAVATGDAVLIVKGSFVCNAGGTIIPRFAENTTATGTLTAYLGATFSLYDMPN